MIRITPAADASVAAHISYLADVSGINTARRFTERVLDTLTQLERRPSVGTPCRFNSVFLHDMRRWSVKGFPRHLVFYRIIPDGIEVVELMHAHRDIARVIGDLSDP